MRHVRHAAALLVVLAAGACYQQAYRATSSPVTGDLAPGVESVAGPAAGPAGMAVTAPGTLPAYHVLDRPVALPVVEREFRGVWVATVGNMDWPSRRDLLAEEQQAELVRILDTARDQGLNAVIFQVRPMADALYESALEPWSEYLTGTPGRDPGWDPLAFAIDHAHARACNCTPGSTRSAPASCPPGRHRRHTTFATAGRSWCTATGRTTGWIRASRTPSVTR